MLLLVNFENSSVGLVPEFQQRQKMVKKNDLEAVLFAICCLLVVCWIWLFLYLNKYEANSYVAYSSVGMIHPYDGPY